MKRASWFGVLWLAAACGGGLPQRYVVERDLEPYVFRRYQHVLDVEFPVEGNAAEGHTATYIRRTKADDVVYATAFVTKYTKAKMLTAEVHERLSTLGTYEVKVQELEGEYVWWVDGGDDRWAVWVSGKYVVKLGAAPGAKHVPEEIAETYLALYPSDLNKYGRARDGTASAGKLPTADDEETDAGDALPKHLREGTGR